VRWAEGDGEQPRRRGTTTEGWGNRQASVRGEHRRELATNSRAPELARVREAANEGGGRSEATRDLASL
jgi:hypothetical protein